MVLFLNSEKAVAVLDQPGVATKRTVLNVFGSSGGHGGRYILDSLKVCSVGVCMCV